MHLADQILKRLLEIKADNSPRAKEGSNALAIHFGVSEEQILQSLPVATARGYIMMRDGFGDNKFTVSLKSWSNHERDLFLENGGFTKSEQQIDDEQSKLNEKLELEIRQIKGQLESFELQKAEAKRTNRHSLWAIWISIAALLASIYSAFK